jgi:hypothetical protein
MKKMDVSITGVNTPEEMRMAIAAIAQSINRCEEPQHPQKIQSELAENVEGEPQS